MTRQRTLLRGGAALLAAGMLAVTLSGCVVVPVPHARYRGVVVEPGYGYGGGPPPPPPPRYRERRDWRY